MSGIERQKYCKFEDNKHLSRVQPELFELESCCALSHCTLIGFGLLDPAQGDFPSQR
jgi:hypothetical protein